MSLVTCSGVGTNLLPREGVFPLIILVNSVQPTCHLGNLSFASESARTGVVVSIQLNNIRNKYTVCQFRYNNKNTLSIYYFILIILNNLTNNKIWKKYENKRSCDH